MNPPCGSRVQRRACTAPLTDERQRVVALFPLARVEPSLAGEAPERAVGADVVEAVIVDADVREVRRHAVERAGAAELEEGAVARRVELENGRSELKALRPLGPAARAVASLHGEHRRAVFRTPALLERVDLRGRQREHAFNLRDQIARRARAVDDHHEIYPPSAREPIWLFVSPHRHRGRGAPSRAGISYMMPAGVSLWARQVR